MADKLATDVEILKREVADMKLIHGRLDNAISKISEVSNKNSKVSKITFDFLELFMDFLRK